MPNFSHDTAGVAYFLATLYQEAKQKEFLAAAIKGANYLLSIADKEGDICLIYHDSTPNGKSLYPHPKWDTVQSAVRSLEKPRIDPVA